MWENLIDWIQNYGWPTLLIIVVAYLLSYFGGLLISPLIRRTVGRIHSDATEEDVKKRQDTLISLLHTLVKVVVWMVAIFTILRQFNIDLAPLLAGASVLGVALGFGAQSLIKDFLSGMFIIMENQYRVGDVVDLEGSAGTVEQITVRTTIVRDVDGNVHFIPNGTIMTVINKTMGFSKINLKISVKPDTDVERLAKVIDAVGEELAKDEKWKSKIISAPKFLNIGDFTDLALEVLITGKTPPSKQWGVTGELGKRLLVAFNKHKIELAQMPGSLTVPSAGKK